MYGLCLALAGLTGCNPPVDPVEVTQLQVEMKSNPLGIDITQPRFSWQIASNQPDLVQVGYHIQVAASPEELEAGKNLVWDSGDVTSEQSLFIPYDGQPLQSKQSYYWRVKVKTNQSAGSWSETQTWSMAILHPAEWKAQWIGENQLSNAGETDQGNTRLAARYLRKPFAIGKEVQRAILYISGLGSSESYLNGKRISEDIFAPMPSHYPTRTYYNVYDVTKLLQQGDNLLGVVLGNGRYFAMRNPGMLTYGLPSLLVQLEVEYIDGTTEQIVSDTSWKISSQGPIVANNEFDGEEYDARKELTGWNTLQYDDSTWKTADLMKEPGGKLTAQPNPNLTIQDTVRPVEVWARPDGKYILDMGQNMVGWLGVQLKGKSGKPITFKFAELLNPDTTLYVANLRSALVTDRYTPSSEEPFHWQPSFVYHGFRYVEIDGLEYAPKTTDFAGYVIYDKMETTGHFKSSNPIIDQIHQNAFWGIRGNYRGMPPALQRKALHPDLHPLKDRRPGQDDGAGAALVGQRPRRQRPHLGVVDVDAAVARAGAVVQHHRDGRPGIFQELQVGVGGVADDGRVAVAGAGQGAHLPQVVVDVGVDHQADGAPLLFQRLADAVPKADHHPGAEVLRPEHGHLQLVRPHPAPQAAGGDVGLVAHGGGGVVDPLLRLLADLARRPLAAEHDADRAGGDMQLLRDLFDGDHPV